MYITQRSLWSEILVYHQLLVLNLQELTFRFVNIYANVKTNSIIMEMKYKLNFWNIEINRNTY